MKVILSRKGFDNQYGGQPSPILPDGTLLSLPIPAENESVKFVDLSHQEKSYYTIIKELKPSSKIKDYYTCHLDPDLRRDIIERPEKWVPLFGQTDSAQGHLENFDVDTGDIFLFFGTFRETELENGILKYKAGTSDIHVIYGFLQIGAKYSDNDILKKHYNFHPHAQDRFTERRNNCIYKALDKLSFYENVPGAGLLNFHKDLVLTKKGMSKSKWDLPEFFKKSTITYHTSNSFKEDYFQSASKGQEFIISESEALNLWVKNIIEKGTNRQMYSQIIPD